MHVCTQTRVHVCNVTCKRVPRYVCMHKCVCVVSKRVHVCANVCACVFVCVFTCTHVHVFHLDLQETEHFP